MKRSPLKDRPLRNPGQSLDERLFDVAYDNLLAPLLVATMFVVMVAVDWWRILYSIPPYPYIYVESAAAVVLLLYAAWKAWRVWPELKNLRQGRDGEKAVGQYLERLREKGYLVFHDLVGKGFNVDHVLIGPAGVFAVETKTFSKVGGVEEKIRFDGETLRIDGINLDRNPLDQAKAQARWLRTLLEESAGRKFLTKSVLLFPGWYVEHKPGIQKDIWVLEPKALPSFLDHEPPYLSAEDVKLASFHLSRYIRTQESR